MNKLLFLFVLRVIKELITGIKGNVSLLFCIGLMITVPLVLLELYESHKIINKNIIIYGDDREFRNSVNNIQHKKHTINFYSTLIIVYSLIILILMDCHYDLGLANWVSGIGSFSAIGWAIFQDYIPPIIKYTRYYDSDNDKLIIQAINYSKTNDFIKIYNIFLYSEKYSVQPKEVKIPYKLRRYRMFQPINGTNSVIIQVFDKNSNMYKKLLSDSNKYDTLIITFMDSYKHERYSIKFPRDYMLSDKK